MSNPVVTTPWGQEMDPAHPDLPAKFTVFQHYLFGHRYRMTGSPGRRTVTCSCRDTPIVVDGRPA